MERLFAQLCSLGKEFIELGAADKNLRLQCALMENDDLYTWDPPVSL